MCYISRVHLGGCASIVVSYVYVTSQKTCYTNKHQQVRFETVPHIYMTGSFRPPAGWYRIGRAALLSSPESNLIYFK